MLSWNVYYGNFNSGNIEVYNIFDHYGFYNDCLKFKKKYLKEPEKFKEEVHRSLMYYFWCKCEWEVIIDHWPSCERMKQKKVDVYSQVNNNFDQFMEYLFAHIKELKKR